MTNLRASIVIDARGDNAARVVEDVRRKLAGIGPAGKAAGEQAAKGLDAIEGSVSQISRSLRTMQGLIVGAFSVSAIFAAGRGVTQTAIAFQGLQTALKAVTGSADAAQRDLSFVRAEAERLGLNLEASVRQFVALAAAAQGTSLAGQGVRDIFTSINEAGVVLGLSTEQLSGSLTAIQQIISKGTVSTEELRQQLGERLFGAFQIAARSIGLTTQELGKLLEQGLIPAERFLPAFARQLRKEFGGGVVEASSGARAEIQRFQTAVTELQLAFASSGFLDSLTSAFKAITQSLADPAFKDGLRQLGAFIGDKLKFVVEHAKEIAIFGAALSGASTGARVGGILGPKGAAIGAGVGAVAAGGGAAVVLSGSGRDPKAPELSLAQRQALLERQIKSLESSVRTASAKERPVIEAQLDSQRKRLADLRAAASKANSQSSVGNDTAFFRGLLDKAGKGGADKLTRLPTLRDEFNQVAALTKDALEREGKLLADQLADNLVSIRDYFAARERISQASYDAESARIDGERREQQALIDALRARQGRITDQNAEAQISDNIAAAQQRIKKLDTELIILGRQRATERTENARQEQAATRALAHEVADLKLQIAEVLGTATPEDRRAGLERQFEGLRKQLRANSAQIPDGESILDRAIDVKAKTAEFSDLERQFRDTLTRMRTAEESINIQRQAGLKSESQARVEILELQRQTAIEVEALIPRMQELTDALPGDDAKNRMAAVRVEMQRLRTVSDDVALAVNGAVRDAFQGMFEDIARGSKSAKEILLDFFRSIEQAITRIAAQKFADQLFGGSGTGGFGGLVSGLLNGGRNNPRSASYENSFDRQNSGGGWGWLSTIGSFFASFFHQGGVVGMGGVRRAVNPLVFAAAPRLHMGGIPGLAAGEVPAILQTGEEVLSRRDPRNRMNGGGVTLQMNVTTPDAGSFLRSRGQIEAEMASMMQRGKRLL